MSISYNEVIDNEIMSEKIIKMLPKVCSCGSPMVFSDSLRYLICSNEKCTKTMQFRVYNLCNILKIPLRYEDIMTLVDRLNLISPYQVLTIEKAVKHNIIGDSDIPNIKEVLQIINKIRNNEYFIYNILELCGIPEISNVAKVIADGFGSVSELYTEIEGGQIAFLNERLGIDNSDSCIISIDIYNKLLNIKEELIFAESLFKIKQYDNALYVAFNDNIGNFLNKRELLEWLSYTFGFKFVHTTVITEKTDILIKYVDTTSPKSRIARMINDKVTAEQVNSGLIELSDVGKSITGELKTVGNQIIIDTLDNIIKRLADIKGIEIDEKIYTNR